ncbi:hypothetical protein PF008_g24242 [Phytophthora fragariae]|uniref:F-box domain-containing protein n=1 Tax=Phytophthora fragariae TaxID=53985 RepID=A0A6G0QNH3_9STRA|nr:hypothetical protein PF008_g24242 [Phytophthora fragariae]
MASSPFSLPLPLLSHILEFAVYGFENEVVPRPPYLSSTLRQLQELALVSKTSLNLMKQFAVNLKASSLTLGSDESMTSEDIPPLYQLVESQGPALRCLSVRLGTESSGYDPEPGALDSSDIEWDRVFGHLSNLKRLDLSKLSLVSRHMPEIVEAASKHCRGLEALILPSRGFIGENNYEYTNAVRGAPIEKLMTTLYEALQSSTQFLENVMKFCPQIEHLDGYKEMLVHGDAQCHDMWAITLETWEAFNKTCTNLREFSWAVVPFADPFFQVFGDHVKPHLNSLSLTANECWNYHRYFRECEGQIVPPPPNDAEEDVEVSRPGYGLLATEITAVLKACPALTDLSVEINCLHNARKKYVNADLYGDDFFEAVADRCPQLESISISDCSGYANFNIKSIETLTDRTLLLLAKMKSLRSIELAPARLTGKGIFDYLCCVSKEKGLVGGERSIEIRMGGHQRTPFAPPRFYAEIVEFLELLSEISEEELGAATCRQKPEIYIKNPYESKVDRIWCEP